MGTDVPLQVGVHDKLLRAVGAFEVFPRGVRAEVKLEVGRVREAFRAMCALKGSFSRMGAFVLLAENSQKRERRTFSAQTTKSSSRSVQSRSFTDLFEVGCLREGL